MAIYTKWAKLLVSVIWIRFYHSNSPLKSEPTDLATSWAPGWTEPYGYNVGKKIMWNLQKTSNIVDSVRLDSLNHSI